MSNKEYRRIITTIVQDKYYPILKENLDKKLDTLDYGNRIRIYKNRIKLIEEYGVDKLYIPTLSLIPVQVSGSLKIRDNLVYIDFVNIRDRWEIELMFRLYRPLRVKDKPVRRRHVIPEPGKDCVLDIILKDLHRVSHYVLDLLKENTTLTVSELVKLVCIKFPKEPIIQYRQLVYGLVLDIEQTRTVSGKSGFKIGYDDLRLLIVTSKEPCMGFKGYGFIKLNKPYEAKIKKARFRRYSGGNWTVSVNYV